MHSCCAHIELILRCIWITEIYGCEPCNTGELEAIPKQCQFATDVQFVTQIFNMAKIKHAERLKGGDNSVRLSTEIGKKIMFKPGIKIVTTEADNVKRSKNVIHRIISYWNFRTISYFIVHVGIVCSFLKIWMPVEGEPLSMTLGTTLHLELKSQGPQPLAKTRWGLKKKTHYHLMLGCHFLYIEKNTVRFLASLLYLPLIYQLNVMNFIMIRFNSSQFCSCFVEVIEKDIFKWTCLHDIL